MELFQQLSDVDLSSFKGQKVIVVKSEPGIPLGIFFEKGMLAIECPWRLRNDQGILMGSSNTGVEPILKLMKLIQEESIEHIEHYQHSSDLVITFKKHLYLELFPVSDEYESWQLSNEDGFLLVGLPGGDYAEFS